MADEYEFHVNKRSDRTYVSRAFQDYEGCPVCCRANVIHVEMDEQGNARVWAELD